MSCTWSVFVCVVYVYTCESNSVESQAKSLASLTRLGFPLAWMEVMAVQLMPAMCWVQASKQV